MAEPPDLAQLAKRYLERHFRIRDSDVSIYWGKVDQFLDELRKKYQSG